MKKIITFLLVFLLGLPLAMADVLPNLKPNEKLVKGKNILEISTFSDWTFFQKEFVSGSYMFSEIDSKGELGCNSGSRGIAREIWAIKTNKDLDLKELLNSYKGDNEKDFYNSLKEKGAIKILEDKELKLLQCNVVVDNSYNGVDKVNKISVDPGLLNVVTEDKFEIETDLSKEKQADITNALDKAFKTFKSKIVKYSASTQQAAYKTLVSKINTMLKTEKDVEKIFRLKYLQYLANKSIDNK